MKKVRRRHARQAILDPPRILLQHKLALTHGAVTLAAALIAEAIALAVMGLILRRPLFTLPTWGTHVAVVVISAALVGLALGAWLSRRVTRRLQHAIEISRAWMRGNLLLRIADPTSDDLGQLARQLDLLAEHLEQDEQDLDELQERNARLSDQVRALAVVEERNRLARELHDSVKQHLFSLAMTASGVRDRLDALQNVSEDVASLPSDSDGAASLPSDSKGAASPSELTEMVQEIETTAQTAQREMTRLIKDLKPSSLQKQGLAAALNDYTLLFGAREHLLIYLEVQGNDALLPPPVVEALYRVAQEALHNTARHARATRVDVHLRCIPELVALTIRDNGVGFDAERVTSGGATHQGLGLTNMEERMLTVGGRLTVESQHGAGTTVLAEVGLTHPLGPRSELERLDRNRPSPTIENWPWLGQRLVIPVGQTWPWLPADQGHLRRPLIEPTEETLNVRQVRGFLGLKRGYALCLGQRRKPLVRVHHGRSGYEWEFEGASWAVRHIRGLSGRMVLMRNRQPLAAMQYQGRLLNTWSEIVYDGRGYRLSYVKDARGKYVLTDETGEELLFSENNDAPQITLRRALPLPLLVMAALRIVDETSLPVAAAGTTETNI
jgi:signal transduction histidine kinase